MSRKVCFDTHADTIASEIYLALQFDLPDTYILLNEDITDKESDFAQRRIAEVLAKHGRFEDEPEKPMYERKLPTIRRKQKRKEYTQALLFAEAL